MSIMYDKLFFQAFHCLPSESKDLNDYSKDDLIRFIELLKKGIEELQVEKIDEEKKLLDNEDFGLSIIATNKDDLQLFQDFSQKNFLPISKGNCHVSSNFHQNFIDQYLRTGINHLRSEYALIILLKNVQSSPSLLISNEKTFSLDNRNYKYQLKILSQDTNLSNEEFLIKIRDQLLGEIFSIDHDDHASIPSLPAPKQPQFVSIFPHTQIACWPLPRRRDLKFYRDDLGVTHILTLLNSRELQKNNICHLIESAGIISIPIPIEGADLSVFTSSQTTIDLLRERIPSIRELLLNSTEEKPVKIIIHCSAGLHRTGTITYLLLRLCQFTIDQSLLILNRTRAITARQVGKKRIDAAEYHLLPKLF